MTIQATVWGRASCNSRKNVGSNGRTYLSWLMYHRDGKNPDGSTRWATVCCALYGSEERIDGLVNNITEGKGLMVTGTMRTPFTRQQKDKHGNNIGQRSDNSMYIDSVTFTDPLPRRETTEESEEGSNELEEKPF